MVASFPLTITENNLSLTKSDASTKLERLNQWNINTPLYETKILWLWIHNIGFYESHISLCFKIKTVGLKASCEPKCCRWYTSNFIQNK
jgi:hypothetical protein